MYQVSMGRRFMGHRLGVLAFVALWIGFIDVAATRAAESDRVEQSPQQVIGPVATSGEAEVRAQLMHELIRGALQIMHRDFFDDENAHVIPSASLEEVFEQIENRYGVSIKWLTVNTDSLNVDHRAADAFERRAADRLGKGETRISSIERTSESGAVAYRYAGAIRLGSQCLKCHVKRRTDNKDRVAGLVLTIPLAQQTAPAKKHDRP